MKFRIVQITSSVTLFLALFLPGMVHADVEGDAWFPEFNQEEWQVLEEQHHTADEKNPHDYSFYILTRK